MNAYVSVFGNDSLCSAIVFPDFMTSQSDESNLPGHNESNWRREDALAHIARLG